MSETKITKKDIEHLKKLARVEFGDAETEDLARDLENILSFVEQLKEADVSSVPEMTHAADLKNVFRKDENPQEFDENRLRRLISLFPEKAPTPFGVGAPTSDKNKLSVGGKIYLKVKAVIKK